MRPNRPFASLTVLLPLLAVLVALVLVWSPVGAGSAPSLRTLIVGGGPEPEDNQVAIERNVHYVSRLLPAGSPRTILFADGSTTTKTVLYEEKPQPLPPGERAFLLLFAKREDASPVNTEVPGAGARAAGRSRPANGRGQRLRAAAAAARPAPCCCTSPGMAAALGTGTWTTTTSICGGRGRSSPCASWPPISPPCRRRCR